MNTAILREALDDAILYRDPPPHCPDCDDEQCILCADCTERLAQSQRYLALRQELETADGGMPMD
jgi:hypothetical protein